MLKYVVLMIAVALAASSNLHATESKNPYDLIDAARKAGTISDAQAALYNAQAFRQLPALPEAYRGDPKAPQLNTTPGHLYTALLIGQFSKLALGEQKQALKLMAPPAYVWNPRQRSLIDNDGAAEGDNEDSPQPDPDPSWITVENTDVKVWYRKEDPRGANFARTLSSSYAKIRDRLVALMDRGPLADGGESYSYETKDGTKVAIGNGGNDKLDIYVMPCPGATFYAYTMPYVSPMKPNPSPAFIVFNSSYDMDDDRLKANLGHEMMHAIQFAFPRLTSQLESYAVNDGVAKWAEELLFPDKHYAHEWVEFTLYGATSLLTDSYATWTFYYYLQHELGQSTLKMIYENMAGKSTYDAIDTTITGGFKKQWPLFTVKEWNQAPGVESFWEWDKYGFTPHEAKDIPVQEKAMTIGAKGDFVDELDFELKPLTRRYFSYAVDSKTKARSISVSMPHYFQRDKIFLKALVKYAGASSWRVEDWNKQRASKELCLDMTDEKLEKLVLIYSNFDHHGTDATRVNPTVTATNLGCYMYKGRIKGSVKGKTISLDMDTDVVFKVANRKHREAGDDGYMPGYYDLTSLKIGYTFQGTQGDCTAFKADTIELSAAEATQFGTLGLYPYHASFVANGRKYTGNILHPQLTPIAVTYHCPKNRTYQSVFQLSPWLAGNLTIPGDTDLLHDKVTLAPPRPGADTLTYEYSLTPATQGE